MKRLDISGLDKNRSIYLKVGFIAALSFVMMAFNYTSKPIPFERPLVERLIEPTPDIPVTTHKEKKKLPPPPVHESFEKIIDTEVPEFVEEPPKISLKIDDGPIVEDGEEYTEEPAEEPYIPEEVEEVIDEPDEDPVLFAEFMPMFGDCDESLNSKERKECSDKALLKYFADNIRYPAVARENGIEGKVVIRFVVDKDGTITMPEALRKVGGGCTEEALRVLKSMPEWKAGRQGGRFVKVLFTVPVSFQLQ